MKILLMLLYWFMGFVMAIGLCCTIGMSINVLIALIRSFSRPKNLGLALGYLLAAGFGCLVLWGGCIWLVGLETALTIPARQHSSWALFFPVFLPFLRFLSSSGSPSNRQQESTSNEGEQGTAGQPLGLLCRPCFP
jgi:hypothetical protein